MEDPRITELKKQQARATEKAAKSKKKVTWKGGKKKK